MDINTRSMGLDWRRAPARGALIAGAAALLVLGVAARSWGQDPAEEAASPISAEPDAPSELPVALPGGEVGSESDSRLRIEQGLGELGDMASDARGDEDIVRLACVQDKQEAAGEVEKIASREVRVLRDPTTAEAARSFALEKLDAAADRMDALVGQARACSGEQGPEDEDDETRNEAEEPSTIPLQDPTLGLGESDLPPPVDLDWLAVASPIE